MEFLPKDVDPSILFYLLILLIGVGSFFFGDFRNQLSRNLQYMAVWVLIFLGAVVLYGFKDTLQAQLFPTSVAQFEGEDILLNRARDGHFYATLTINDADIEFLVDTGATSVVLSRDDAQKIGLDLDRLAYTGRAQTANGMVSTANIRLDEVRFGGRLDRNIRASVNGGDLDGSLLGMSYLSRFSVIQIEGNTLRLIP